MNDEPVTEPMLPGLAWAAVCLEKLPRYRGDYEISGKAARRVGSIYFATSSPANDMRFTILRKG